MLPIWEQARCKAWTRQTWDWNVQRASVAEFRWLGFSNPMSPKGERWGTQSSWGGQTWATRRIERRGKLDLMACINDEKKRIESWFLGRAREAGVPIPSGEICGEEPDFTFDTPTGALGIELSEVLRPASSNCGILPVAEESFHREIVETAQQTYYAISNVQPVHVSVYFTNARGKRRDKRKMADALAEFVKAEIHRATPAVTFERKYAPDGFDSVTIVAEPNPIDWWSGEGGGIALGDIRPQVEARISEKDKLVQTYRANLPDDAQVWLLLYTGVTVARNMPIPHDIETWHIPFTFDRVFWFTSLEGQFVEIRRRQVGGWPRSDQ